ncbi:MULTISPECIES: hypothetical protein [Clostridium]|uniref:hypothetical protein n=1 Tax=Clostridium TaxID=1485 RepID=UPI000DF8FA90|nr:hypothetical protein [Clostridium sporogenes]MCW6084826.1 hypothetical protein [Clostridium sporogenes]MDU6336867.1 hypothetical protein [Clostridium sporogenes]UBI13722.1 hypothetical protein LA336_09405 [Clostridium sporogenes]STC83266.1 cell adhesion domain-containing protein [Clostridium botulinum]
MLDERNITYDLKYEADVLPTDNKYRLIEIYNSNAIATINNGILNIKTTNGSLMYGGQNIINSNNVILVKTKGKVLSGDWYICDIIDGSKRCVAKALPDRIYFNGKEFSIDMTKEHEIFIIKNKQIDTKIYIDGKLLDSLLPVNDTINRLGFGNGSTSTSDDIYIDYFYYNLNFDKDKLDELKYYLLKQNKQYYTIKSEFYKNGEYKSITELEGNEILTKTDFETYGIYDLDLLAQTIDTQVVNGIDKGSLGSGKYFEIELNNFIKKINSQPIPKEFEVTNDMWSNKVSLPWTNGMGNGGFIFNIVEDVYYKLQTKVLNNAKITVYFFDGTTFSDTTNYNGKVTILNNIKKINKINISGAHGGGGNFTIQQFNLFKTKNIKYLIYCNNQIYSFNGKEILLSDSQFIDQNNFINNGFTNTTVITEGQWNIAFPDKSNLKLLMWTDDMSKTDVSLETEIIPFRPIDKLKKNSDICNILFKEV